MGENFRKFSVCQQSVNVLSAKISTLTGCEPVMIYSPLVVAMLNFLWSTDLVLPKLDFQCQWFTCCKYHLPIGESTGSCSLSRLVDVAGKARFANSS